MRSEFWGSVKVGDLFIKADQYYGVRQVKVIEVDVHFYRPSLDPKVPSKFDYPYGLTKDFGTVTVLEGEAETIMNLKDLIPFRLDVFDRLTKAYDKYREYYGKSEEFKDAFMVLLRELV